MIIATGSQDEKWDILLSTFDGNRAEIEVRYKRLGFFTNIMTYAGTRDDVPQLIKAARKYIRREDEPDECEICGKGVL